MTDPRSRLILALDMPDRTAALAAVERLAGHVGCFKLGLELFIAEGPGLVKEIRDRGEKVFLDLKLHDIPNTVEAAVRSACRLGIQMLTVHAAGGLAMLEAARGGAEASASPPLLIAVTALTSLSAQEISRLGVHEPMQVWVERLAEIACQARLPALVASPWELERMRQKFGAELYLIAPGIRPAGTSSQNHARTSRPGEAIHAGADFIVVGRPILQAPDPIRAADEIVKEIGSALAASRKNLK